MANRRKRQALNVARFGFDVMPCSRCADLDLMCRMARGSSKYASCIRANLSCDGNAVPLDSLDRLGNELDRLEAEDAAAERAEEELRARRRRLKK